MLPFSVHSTLNPTITYERFFADSYIGFTSHFRGGLSGDDYAERITNSKIVLCPRGFKNVETFRHFEAMRAGAVVISDPLPGLDFYSGSPIICLKNWTKLRKTVKNLLKDPDALFERQKRTLDWWERHCSEGSVARKIAATISLLGKEG